MVFDVIIPVYKPDEKLDALLAALLRQLHAPRAVILLITRDTGNDAEAEALAARLRATDARVKTRILDKAEYDHAGTRNLGVSLMEDNADWHFKMPYKKELKTFMEELDITEQELSDAKVVSTGAV